MTRRIAIAIIVAGAACAGCGDGWGWGDSSGYVKPTIAVMKFENRAPFVMKWNLGDGMRDVLVDRLVATGRFHVIERAEIGSVMQELQFQQSGATRKEARAEVGRGKNVRYLIKGTITDFGHVSSTSVFADLDLLGVFGGKSRAVMGMTMYVVDVETFEVIASESICESVRATDIDVKARYGNVGFGGSAFYQTPLGQATAKVIDKAISRISKTIAAQPWAPRIATVSEDGRQVTLNGGKDRKVAWGTEYEVIEPGPPIIDPDTGDVLGRQASKALGRIRVREVFDRYATADVLERKAGAFESGQLCRPVAPAVNPR